MSRKTQEIYKTLENLESLQKQLEEISSRSDDRELDNLQFGMKQELGKLSFLIKSLYSLNGKSTSNAKQNSSRENGKKGGRPPKKITIARRRLVEIENELIPELENRQKMENDFDAENEIKAQIEALTGEKSLLEKQLSEWKSVN